MKRFLKYLLITIVVLISLILFIKLINIANASNTWWINLVGRIFRVSVDSQKIIIATVIEIVFDIVFILLLFA